ncbi:MAG TPA: ATP-binding protein [Planctomycetota bacterium]
MTSIRARVMLGAMLAAWGVQAVLAVISYITTRDLLCFNFDDELRTHAGAMAALVHRDGDRLVIEFAEEVMPFYRSSEKAEYFEVSTEEGRTIGRSQSLGDHHLPRDWGTPDEPRTFDVVLPDGRPGRCIGVRYALKGGAICVSVAEPRYQLDEALGRVVVSSTLTTVGLGLVLALLLWLVLRHGFRPLGELSARVAGIDARQPPGGLGLEGVPDELAPVVACLDDLLMRMRSSIERERRVTANIAHELQTPVAELRTVTDVAMRWPNDVDYLRRAATATNGIAQRMEAVTTKILELATAESGANAIHCAPVEVASLLREVTDAVRSRCVPRSIQLTVEAPATVVASTDAVVLRVILSNLAHNAVDHAPMGTTVHVALASLGGVVFTFRNAAPDLVPEDLQQLTEPYWRKDAGRAQGGVAHAGIGLALAKELGRRLGGELQLTLEDGILSVRLHLASAAG